MNKLFTKIIGAALGLTMAIGVGVAIGNNSKVSEVSAAAGDSPIILDGTNLGLSSTATTGDTEKTYGGVTYVVSTGAKNQTVQSGATKNFTSNPTILIGKSGTYIYNKTAIPGEITKFEIYANKGASTKVSVGVNFSATAALTSWSATGAWTATLSTVDSVYDASSKIVSGAKYFRYQVTNANNSQVQIRITYTAQKYTVTYNPNNATSGTVPTDSTQYTNGSTVTVKGNTGSLARTGYTFGGWNTKADGTGTNYVAGSGTFSISGNTTLYAKWIATTYSISYTLDGGTHGSTHPTSGTYDTAFSVSAPTKTGYTFTGWTVTSGLDTSTAKWGTTSSPSTAISSSSTLCVNGTNAVYFKNINAASTAVTLTANWTINSYTVGDSITNGSLSSTSNVDYNDPLSITIVPDQDYTYPSSIDSVTMGGAAYAGYTYNPSDGSFYIEHVTGNVVINAACVSTSATERFFHYHLTNCSIENAPESMYDTEMKILQIVAADHYKFPSSIGVTGISEEKWTYDPDGGTILINQPDGDIDLTVTCVAKARNIIAIGTLTGVTQKSGDPTEVEEGDIVTLTFIASSGYGLPTSSGVDVIGVDSQSWSWNQNSGELEILGGTSDITVSVVGTLRDLTDGSLTLGTKQTSYSLGDTFVKPSTITANFNVAPTTADVKNDVVVTGPINDDLVVTGSGTITITYTFPSTGSTQSASYAITATPITPVSGGYTQVTSSKTNWSGTYVIASDDYLLGNTVNSGRIANGGSAPTVVNNKITSTVTDAMKWTIASTTGGYTFKNLGNNKYLSSTGSKNAGTMVDSLDSDGKTTWTISFSSNTFTIVNKYNSEHSVNATLVNNGTYGWATYANNGSGKPAHLYEYTAPVVAEIKWITAEVKPGTYYQGNSVTASDFTVTAHYNDGETSTLSSGVTVTNGYLANIGDNEVTLTYSGKSCKVNVIAVEQTAEYTGLSWAQGEYTIIDGQNIDFSKFGTVTAEYNDGEIYATKAISSCNVATYTKSGDVYTKVADLDDGDTITSSSHGKYLGVTYTETNTHTAYSSAPIYVVEAIHDVYKQIESWTFTNKATSLSDGDKVVMVASGFDFELTAVNTEASTPHGTGTEYSTCVAGTYVLTVEHVSGNIYAFKDSSNRYLKWSSGNSLTLSDANIDVSQDSNSTWAVTFNGMVAQLVNQGTLDDPRTLAWNNTDNSKRFANYKDATITGQYANNYSYVSFYIGEKGYVPSGESFANTNATVQKAVLQFAEHFNDTMDCVNSGTTDNVASKWSTLSSGFSTAMSGFIGDDLAHFKALFANAYSVVGGDTLQDMLARYDYIVSKYKLSDDFLHDYAGRGAVAYSARVTPFNIIGNNGNTVAIIVIISMISITAIGGYFFLRKRKEN